MMMLIFYLCIRTGFYSAAGFMASSVSGIEVFLPYSLPLPFSYSSSPLPYSLHIHSIIMFIKSNNPIITDNRPDRDARTIDRCSHDGCQGLEGASSTPHYQYFFLLKNFFSFLISIIVCTIVIVTHNLMMKISTLIIVISNFNIMIHKLIVIGTTI